MCVNVAFTTIRRPCLNERHNIVLNQYNFSAFLSRPRRRGRFSQKNETSSREKFFFYTVFPEVKYTASRTFKTYLIAFEKIVFNALPF